MMKRKHEAPKRTGVMRHAFWIHDQNGGQVIAHPVSIVSRGADHVSVRIKFGGFTIDGSPRQKGDVLNVPPDAIARHPFDHVPIAYRQGGCLLPGPRVTGGVARRCR